MKMNFTTLSLAFVTCLFLTKAVAQPIAIYSFTSSNSTYVPIATGTVLGDTSSDVYSIYNNLPIGFAFNYGGVNHSTVSVSQCGYIKLGGVLKELSLSPIGDELSSDTVIAIAAGVPLRPGGDGEIRFNTSGTSPNQVFTLQWKNYNLDYDTNSANFQLKLHETSNKIEFHYGDFLLDTISEGRYFQIGLRGNFLINPEDYHSRFVDADTNTWVTSKRAPSIYERCIMKGKNPVFKPAPGLLWTWMPGPACTGSPVAGVANAIATTLCPGQKVDLYLLGSSGYLFGRAYTWQSSSDGTNWTTVASQTYIPFTPLFSSNIYYRCKVSCGTDSATSNALLISSTPANTYASVPLSESFNSSWESRCGFGNVPNAANWSNTPGDDVLSWMAKDPSDFFLPSLSGKAATFTSNNSINSSTTTGLTGDLDLFLNLGNPALNYSLSFFYINPYASDSLEIMLSTNGGSNFTSKGFILGGQIDTVQNLWNKRTYNLGAVNSSTSVLRLRGHSNTFGFTRAIDSLDIKTSPNTGVSQINNQTNIQLFPNPNHGLFTLKFENENAHNIQIFDPTGRVVLSESVEGNQYEIQLKDISKGLYFVKIQTDTKDLKVLRFVKE